MPNWVRNKLLIKGDSNSISECLEMIYSSRGIDFSKLIPPHLNADSDWYYKHWGTKWNATSDDTIVLLNEENTYIVKFITANSPPKSWLKTLASKFPQLLFVMWYVDANEYYGKIKIVDGKSKSLLWDPEADEDNDWEGNDHYIYFMNKHFRH